MKPTAIKIAEDLNKIYQSAEDAYNANPSQAVFTLSDIVKMITSYGHPAPDFTGYGNFLVANSDKAGVRAFQIKVGRKIEEELKKRGITQKQFAEMIGRPASQVNNMTSGSNLELSTLYLIQQTLKIKLVNV